MKPKEEKIVQAVKEPEIVKRKTKKQVDRKVDAPVIESKAKTPVVESRSKTPVVERKAKSPIVNSKAKASAVESKTKVPVVESKAEPPIVKAKEKRKNLKTDLAEIEFGITERPLNLDNLFPRRASIDESIGVPDSPKSLTSNDDVKITSAKDSAYSGSRKSSANEKEIHGTVYKNKMPASYINVLKEISSSLVGFDDEPFMFIESQVKTEPKRAQILHEPSPSRQKVKENYTKVLQDISSNLIGLDLHGFETRPKNYSQIIPPFVQDQPIRKIPSVNNLDVPNGNGIHEFYPSDEVIDVVIPVAPVRRHRSAESTDAPEVPLRTRRLPASKSFDYDTVSGRTSKNSTEYYDHYLPSSNRRLEKYEPPAARKESIDGGMRTRTRQRAIDDLVVKSAATRMYEAEDVPLRRQMDYRREESEPSDANALLERSQMLHRRKESFMRGQMNESNNPYIREMMKQDVDNPIDISDIRSIRKHPTAPLLSTSVNLSSYQRPASYVPSSSTRMPLSYGTSSHMPVTTSYSRTSAMPVSSYKSPTPSSLGYLNPSSSTAAHILTKSHTLSPPTSSYSSSYNSRSRPVTSLSDQHSSSRFTSRPSSYSQNKSSGSSRDACVIS